MESTDSPNIQIEEQRAVEFSKPEAKFRTRAFEINIFSDHQGGLEFQSGNLLPRPSAKSILEAQGDYGSSILKRISSDIKNREVPSSLEAALEGSKDSSSEQARLKIVREVYGDDPVLLDRYEKLLRDGKLADHALLSAKDRSKYIRKYEGTNKLGLFNLEVSSDGRAVKADIRKVPYVFYKHIRTPYDEENGLMELANPTGVAVVIETSDGYFGLGRRGPKNGSYRAKDEGGGQPGAFAAGLIDMNFSRLSPPGLPENIANRKVIGAATKELKEETGIEYRGDLFNNEVRKYATSHMKVETGLDEELFDQDLSSSLKITSIGRDLVNPHNEIGITLQVPTTRENLIDIHNSMERNESEKDFSEGIFFIPATREAVTRFVTECKAPMPPTHYMPLISAMYEKIASSGDDKDTARIDAEKWLSEIQSGLDANWAEIDDIVSQHYLDNPDAVEVNRIESKRESINTAGFDPAVLADDQGLPTLNSELVRLGFSQK